jgi:hypothetical protein
MKNTVEIDRTDLRIHSYLASVKPLDPRSPSEDGRALIEKLANTEGDEMLRFSSDECADVLAFMACTHPKDPRNWWIEPKGEPSRVCGFYAILNVLADSITASENSVFAARGTTAAAILASEKLMEAVQDQRSKLLNVLGLTQALKIAGAAADNNDEPIDNLEGALQILQDALQGVVEGLEPIMLNRAVAAAEEGS